MLRTGFIAGFKTAYLQIAIIEPRAEVMGGTDKSFDNVVTGYIPGRLVKVTRLSDGSVVVAAPTGVSATSIGNATHIISQSDESLKNVPSDYIQTELYTTRSRGILGNTASGTVPTAASSTMKSIALYKISNADDILITNLG